ncbi:DUF6894 family protein [Bradyrhizobium sp.]|jgi:hypothetical protein|uniref:DUF6894 family protein n=1 Tax=Bradyrhizobium sp. TaxID=376 RepID=UPI002E0B6745|nr:hypothetical protein [Bradyrhizobium sp.]
MSRYFLHLRDFKGELIEDEEGSDLPSLSVAKEHAMLAMHDLVAEAIRRGDEPSFEAIVVADERGTHVAAVPLLAAIVGLLKHPEKVVRAGRFEEYRRNADQCRGKAENTAEREDKISWLKLADAWLQMLPPTHSPSGDLAGWPRLSDTDSKASH